MADPTTGQSLIAAERRRQIEQEGWSAAGHDDEHGTGDLMRASDCYQWTDESMPAKPPRDWPWAYRFWKPKDRRANLVRAGALAQAAADVALRRRDQIAAQIDALADL